MTIPSDALKAYRERVTERQAEEDAKARKPIEWQGGYDDSYHSAMELLDDRDAEVVTPLAHPVSQLDLTGPVKCGGDGIANTRCRNPAHVTTKWGATYSDWICRVCGGSGRNTWD